MKLPNTILIGAQKAGTSSLYNWIGQHPNVFAPEAMKDFHFFTLEQYLKKGLDYLASFYSNASKEKVLMQGAVNYIFFPVAAKRIHDFNPEAKLILILRNPVKRAVSAYNYFYKLGVEQASFEEAIEREKKGLLKSIKEQSDFAYINHGFYHKQLSAYFKYFRKDQIKIVIYEEVIKDKTTAINDIYDFLELENSFIPDFNHVNKTGNVRFRFLNKLIFSDNWFKKIFRKIIHLLLPIETRIKIGNWMREHNIKKKGNLEASKTLSEEMEHKLKDIFRDDHQKLCHLLGRDSIWDFD